MAVWWLASAVPHFSYMFLGSRMYMRWVGLRPLLISTIMNSGTLAFFVVSFGGVGVDRACLSSRDLEVNTNCLGLHNYLILLMAFTLWYDTKVSLFFLYLEL